MGIIMDWKVYYIVGRVCYGFCNYLELKEYFFKVFEFNLINLVIKKEYEWCFVRLYEEEIGDYDFEVIYKFFSLKNVYLDLGFFICNIEVKVSLFYGRGLFVIKDFVFGDFVFVEKVILMFN